MVSRIHRYQKSLGDAAGSHYHSCLAQVQSSTARLLPCCLQGQVILLHPPETITPSLLPGAVTRLCSWLPAIKLKDTAGWKGAEYTGTKKHRVQNKERKKKPRGSKEELLNEKHLATSKTKLHDQKCKLFKLSEKTGEHVWRVNCKRSLEMVATHPVESDRSLQKQQDFCKDTHRKTSLHNINLWARKHISSECFSHHHLLPLKRKCPQSSKHESQTQLEPSNRADKEQLYLLLSSFWKRTTSVLRHWWEKKNPPPWSGSSSELNV